MKDGLSTLLRWKLLVPAFVVAALAIAGVVFSEPLTHAYKMYGLLKMLDVRGMSEQQRVGGARVIVESCMNVQPGENVLLIVESSEKRDLVGKYLDAEVVRLNAKSTVIKVKDDEMKVEPPQRVADAMMKSDVILAVLSLDNIQIFAHSKARNRATDEEGARLGLTPALFPDVTHDDIMQIRRRTDELAALMDQGKRARVTSSDGTDLSFSIEGRKAERLRASMWERGEWGAVPLYAEAALAPVEGTANGRFVVNGFFEPLGRVTEPFAWIIQDGKIVEVEGEGGQAEECRKVLAESGENATNVAELGVATNHIIPFDGFTGTIVDKMILGTLHIACGKNTTFVGGQVHSNVHYDAVSAGMTLEIDGKRVLENGKWMLD